MAIRVFTTPACPYCYTLKEFLKERNFEFTEVNITKDTAAQEEIKEKTGQIGAPVVDIDGTFIIGFDREKIVKLLKIQE